MIGTFIKLVGKAIGFTISRPLQRFNIANRAKKYLGEDAKYFMPAPRAIGKVSQIGGTQYPHLENPSGFKSVKQLRLEAIAARNRRLLEQPSATSDSSGSSSSSSGKKGVDSTAIGAVHDPNKSYSEIRQDDGLVIETANKLPAIRTVTIPNLSDSVKQLGSTDGDGDGVDTDASAADKDTKLLVKPHRPMPTSTNLPLHDQAIIWQVDKVPPGRLDVSKFQELMINVLADAKYWTPKQISESYNIKEEYAENIIKYFKQIRIVITPRIAKTLDYVARDNPIYQATKHVIYHVDNSLRTKLDKAFDGTFLPTDELDPEVRAVLDVGKLQEPQTDPRLTRAFKRPEPLRTRSINKSDADDEKPRLTQPPKSSLPPGPPAPPANQ